MEFQGPFSAVIPYMMITVMLLMLLFILLCYLKCVFCSSFYYIMRVLLFFIGFVSDKDVQENWKEMY